MVKWVPAKGRWCSTAGKVTAGLAISNGSIPPGGWCKSPAGWLLVHRDQLRVQRSVKSMGSLYLFRWPVFVVQLFAVSECVSTDLKRISELQQQQQGSSLDLEPYLKKLNNARRRVVLVNNVLQNAQVDTDWQLHGGSAVGHWTCDLQVASSIPGRWLSHNIGQLSPATLRGRWIEYLLQLGVKAGFSPLSGGR